ncbi:MAG: filamentous hemagglutinin N-terminal domain-containing protein [Chloroflexaceae bacterium]|nr:filamentous hemagglutinin N-terminal domain-containing protein [Chloroflexaceae bacterium]
MIANSPVGTNSSVTLTAGTDIAIANVTTQSQSGAGTAGSVTLTADTLNTGSGSISAGTIDTRANPSSAAADLPGSGGAVTLDAGGLIEIDSIDTSSGSSTQESGGGNISITSRNSSIITGTTGGQFNTFSRGGNSGTVTLEASQQIQVNYINTTSSEAAQGGNVYITSSQGGVTFGAIATTAIGGNAGRVDVTAEQTIERTYGEATAIDAGAYSFGSATVSGGNITLTSRSGNILIETPTFSNNLITTADNGSGGVVTLQAGQNIRVGDIDTSSDNGGSAGQVRLRADTLGSSQPGTVQVSSIDASGAGDGSGGNIDVIAERFQATGMDDLGNSLLTSPGSTITIRQGGFDDIPVTPFIVGGISSNGTAGAISTETETLNPTLTFSSDFTSPDGTIQILGLAAPPLPIVAADDGTGSMVSTTDGLTFDISGGLLSGDNLNLFHSFTRFDLPQSDQIANFIVVTAGLENLLARVSSGDASDIHGTIQITDFTGGNPNLFLINPAGIVFADSAQLNVPAAFTATAANGILFGDAWFSGSGLFDPSLLNGMPGASAFTTSQPGAIISGANLTTPNGDLQLSGGTVISTGQLSGDRITIATVAGGTVLIPI